MLRKDKTGIPCVGRPQKISTTGTFGCAIELEVEYAAVLRDAASPSLGLAESQCYRRGKKVYEKILPHIRSCTAFRPAIEKWTLPVGAHSRSPLACFGSVVHVYLFSRMPTANATTTPVLHTLATHTHTMHDSPRKHRSKGLGSSDPHRSRKKKDTPVSLAVFTEPSFLSAVPPSQKFRERECPLFGRVATCHSSPPHTRETAGVSCLAVRQVESKFSVYMCLRRSQGAGVPPRKSHDGANERRYFVRGGHC